MATRLLFNGTEFQVNLFDAGDNGVLGSQSFPDATTLTDGRFVIGYESPNNGSDADVDPIARILGGFDHLDIRPGLGIQIDPDLAARNSGGFGIVFSHQQHANGLNDANGPNIVYRTVSTAGAIGLTVAIGDFDGGMGHDVLSNP